MYVHSICLSYVFCAKFEENAMQHAAVFRIFMMTDDRVLGSLNDLPLS